MRRTAAQGCRGGRALDAAVDADASKSGSERGRVAHELQACELRFRQVIDLSYLANSNKFGILELA
jgi:hypothetical protein